MSAHAQRSSGFASFLLGIVFAVLLVGAIMVWRGAAPDREAPLRTVELTVPTPEIPVPPGTIPDSGAASAP